MVSRSTIAVTLVAVATVVIANPYQRWEIKLVDGGYEDILVVISDRVDGTHKETILNNIEVGDINIDHLRDIHVGTSIYSGTIYILINMQ